MDVPEDFVPTLQAQGATVYKGKAVHVTQGASMNDFYNIEIVYEVLRNLAIKASTNSMQAEDHMLLQILNTANIVQLKVSHEDSHPKY